MIIYVAIIALQVYCIVHVIRNNGRMFWIFPLLIAPVVSAIAYFIVEILPTLQHNRHVRTAKEQIVQKMDPERELRAAQGQLDIADTMANRIRVADALTELGRHKEALPLYQRGAGPRPDFRTGEKLARSLYLNDRNDEALSVLDVLPRVTGQSDIDRTKLLRARILEDMGRSDEALELYTEIMDRMPGDEARCRCAALLLKVGRKSEAVRVLEEVEQRMKYIDRHTKASNGPMYEWAMKELGALRT